MSLKVKEHDYAEEVRHFHQRFPLQQRRSVDTDRREPNCNEIKKKYYESIPKPRQSPPPTVEVFKSPGPEVGRLLKQEDYRVLEEQRNFLKSLVDQIKRE